MEPDNSMNSVNESQEFTNKPFQNPSNKSLDMLPSTVEGNANDGNNAFGTNRESLFVESKSSFSTSDQGLSYSSLLSGRPELSSKMFSNNPDYMARASVIPVRSFTSNDSQIHLYTKDDYSSIDKIVSVPQEEQEPDNYNWENIINEKLDRDSWSGGVGLSGQKKHLRPHQDFNDTHCGFSEGNLITAHSSVEGAYKIGLEAVTETLSKPSLYSDFSDITYSNPETYISESELATKPELYQTFQDRQNERTKRLAIKMLDVIDSLTPAKHILPTYRTTKYTIPISMHTFKLNRIRLHERMVSKDPRGFVMLKGGELVHQYNTDCTYTFRQEPFFHWMFGVRHTSFWGGICLRTGTSFLFMPRRQHKNSILMSKPLHPNDIKKMYGVSKVIYIDEMNSVLEKYRPRTLFLLSGKNSDSDLVIDAPLLPFETKITIDITTLHQIMSELRVIKNDYEIELIRQACIISSDAHKYVMHSMVGMVGYYEYQVESLFLHYCSYMGGCRTTAFPCICGTGSNTAIQHYGHLSKENNKVMNSGDLCLFDMGASYYGYASDIACTFPVNGVFTDDQKIIYNAVLKGRDRAIQVIRPGVRWDQVHLEVLLAIFTEMKKEALLFGEVDEMIEAELGAVFMPHGVGHLLGIDVHDVGGYGLDTPPRPTRLSLIDLRTSRRLVKNMVLTIEPSCYFIEKLLEEADENQELAKFINFQKISQFNNFDGVRIEDVVLVTEFGCELLSDVPRTVEEIEAWMNSQPFEGGFDQNLGFEYLPCMCAKLPQHISQLRKPTKDIMKGLCSLDNNEIYSSSSAMTLQYERSICSSRDSVSEVFEGEKFTSKEQIVEKEDEEAKPEVEQSEIGLEEQYASEEGDPMYWRSRAPFMASDTSSSFSSKHRYNSRAMSQWSNKVRTSRENKIVDGTNYKNPLQAPKAPPPTKPTAFASQINATVDQKSANVTTPHYASMNPHARDEDLLIVTEKESKNTKLK